MAEADWNETTYIRKKQPKSGQLKTQQALNAAQRSGVALETNKKFSGGQNKQHSAAKNTARLDRETEELHHDTLGLSVAKLIQQKRQEKEWTQKDLATRINEKQHIINEYEQGKAIPNQQIMTKLERALGVRLRGKDMGKPFGGPKK